MPVMEEMWMNNPIWHLREIAPPYQIKCDLIKKEERTVILN